MFGISMMRCWWLKSHQSDHIGKTTMRTLMEDGMVFVVDSSDEERLNECFEELNDLMGEETLAKVPLLVYASQ